MVSLQFTSNYILAQKKKAALKKKQDEELLYETLLPLLPAKRLAAREKVLKTHRSYQVKQILDTQ